MLSARSKGRQERLIALAHQTAMFGREKRLKPLPHYLGRQKAGRDDAAVLGMFRQLATQGKAVITTIRMTD